MLDALTIIRSIFLILASVLILLSAIGILRFKDDMDKVVYARIHILGVADMGCILALFALYNPLLGAAYLILSPFAAHAIANAFYYGEENHD
ncbi:MAG: monovalent cation/H(+) antiporter subunit G [Methanobacteriaceae archaeon]|jgi:energy-converting hydrogenase B subunit C|nr:monovalent cation/H(+) antiporter subunit G [Methanobacteriaceae archaeon]MDO9627968.1 monovalent cation/H(+) antiporter subunit G [Methanobacteriaceae archaeon]